MNLSSYTNSLRTNKSSIDPSSINEPKIDPFSQNWTFSGEHNFKSANYNSKVDQIEINDSNKISKFEL